MIGTQFKIVNNKEISFMVYEDYLDCIPNYSWEAT